MTAMGRLQPVVTDRDFSNTATCYAGPTAEIGQKRTKYRQR
jgi:hypothetical protein